MFALDFVLMALGLLTFLAQAVLLALALFLGVRSLFLLRRPIGNAARGHRLSLIAIGLCVAIEVWSVLFFVPWRFHHARPLLWMPFIPLQFALIAAVLWGMRGTRASGTARLMAIVAVIAVATAGGQGVQRWDRRREYLHSARGEEELATRFQEAYRRERNLHNDTGAKCFLHFAEQASARAKDARRQAGEW